MRTRFFCWLTFFAFLCSIHSSSFAQDKVTEQIEKLVKRDSLNELIISELKNELKQLKTPVSVVDSSSTKNIQSTNLPSAEREALKNFKDRGNGSQHTSLI